MKRLILSVFLVVSVAMGLFGVISGNDTEKAYNEGGDSSQTSSGTRIKTLVILGAGYFLKSHADFQLFLQQIEMAELTGTHYDQWQYTLGSAIANMESAGTIYRDLKDLAAVTPYNTGVIDKLTIFAYPGFMEKLNLNPGVFEQVEALLGQGNVTGVYEHLFAGTTDILAKLYQVKLSVDTHCIPAIPGLWDLNQRYSDALFFGQYVAMIFKEIE